ncbi:TPA: HindVP family restriction endonuclease [Photobacterium damselae]
MKPSLFGLKKSNRDFSSSDSWGKNQFNSSFPAALCAYMESKGMMANYICFGHDKIIIKHSEISYILGMSTLDSDSIFYGFESQYSPFNTYVRGTLPRTDLVIFNAISKECIRGLEIKLTALPDQTTFSRKENEYGSELVVRPDTIVYLACSLIMNIEAMEHHIESDFSIRYDFDLDILDWSDNEELIKNKDKILDSIFKLSNKLENNQTPVLLQPIWKTLGKSPDLADNCLDIFVWSDVAFTRFIHDIAVASLSIKNPKITRQYRTVIWLFKMLKEYFEYGTFNFKSIIDELSYNIKNDKAFSSQGTVTNKFMSCDSLVSPRIKKDEIKSIILGGGQDLLSPERRFDAIIYNSPNLFK